MSDETPRTDDIGSTDPGRNDARPPVTRRKFLGTLGVSGVGLAELGPLLRSGDDPVTLVVAKLGDEPLRTETVPARWYRQTKRAERVADQLKRTLLPEPGVTSVGVGLGDRYVGDLRTKAVSVGTRPGGASVTIPDEVDGVPVVEDRGETVEFTNCYEKDYDPVPGGVTVEDIDSKGSTCCRCWRDGTPYLLTVRHLVASGACDDDTSAGVGDYIYQNGDYIGTVEDVYVEHDSALVNWDSNGSRDSYSADVVDSSVEIEGHVTKDGLSTLQSNGSYIDRRGIASCKDTHQVEKYAEDYWCNDTNVVLTELVYLSGSASSGDSGGPVFNPDGDSTAPLANMVSGNISTSSNSYVFGAAGYGMSDLQNITFS
jgi:hypothetical protein